MAAFAAMTGMGQSVKDNAAWYNSSKTGPEGHETQQRNEFNSPSPKPDLTRLS
jgi:hypothetical protein